MERLEILWKSLVDFFRHDGPMLAGSIAFFFMMSMAPFILLLVAGFGYFLGEHQEFYDFLAIRLAGLFPQATKDHRLPEDRIFTLTLYAYFSYQLYFSLERAVNMILQSAGKRSLLKSLLMFLFVTVSLMVLLFLFFGAKVFLSLLEPLAQVFPELKIGTGWWAFSCPGFSCS